MYPNPSSNQTNREGEPHSITKLNLSDPHTLSVSIKHTCRDLLRILYYYANNAHINRVESTHQIRKKLKFFRAFVKLLKQYHTEEALKRVNIDLRDYGRVFSGLRDAHVREMMLNEFLITPEIQLSSEMLHKLNEINQKEIQNVESGLFEPDNQYLQFASQVKQNKFLTQFTDLKDPDPNIIIDVFKLSFKKSSNAYSLAIETGKAEPLHEWRKRLKDVQYQFEMILNHVPPDKMNIFYMVELTCNYLGRHNDIEMFQEWLTQIHPDRANVKNAELLTLNNYLNILTEDSFREIKSRGQNLYNASVLKL